jgi:hypothetical protein
MKLVTSEACFHTLSQEDAFLALARSRGIIARAVTPKLLDDRFRALGTTIFRLHFKRRQLASTSDCAPGQDQAAAPAGT